MGALDKVRVLDLTRLLPGPFCTMLLGDLGADVIKVEEKGRGDYARDLLPEAYYSANRNKRSIAVDLKPDSGKEIVKMLAEKCQVFVEGFRPGVAERLGVGYQTVRERNPGIIYCSISGYGQHGPYSQEPGHDINYLSLAGAMSIPGEVGKAPARSGLPVGDLVAAMYATVGILAALQHQRETGRGQYIDISIADCIFSWASIRFGGMISDPGQALDQEFTHVRASNGVFETGAGGQIALGVLEDNFWEGLCRGLGRPELMEDGRFKTDQLRFENSAQLHRELSGILLGDSRENWLKRLKSNNVPVTPVNSLGDALLDPHLKARGMVERIPFQGGELVQVPFAGKFSVTPPSIRYPPPGLGEHTEQILTGDLGFSREKIRQLRQSGVIE